MVKDIDPMRVICGSCARYTVQVSWRLRGGMRLQVRCAA